MALGSKLFRPRVHVFFIFYLMFQLQGLSVANVLFFTENVSAYNNGVGAFTKHFILVDIFCKC
jgi:hypothetical protein